MSAAFAEVTSVSPKNVSIVLDEVVAGLNVVALAATGTATLPIVYEPVI